MKYKLSKQLVLNKGTVVNLNNVKMGEIKGGTEDRNEDPMFWPLT